MNYEKIYSDFLAKYKDQDFNEKRYEVHHIVPRHMGGNDEPTNLIKLTSRQHRFAHACLYKMYGSRWDKVVWLYLLNKDEDALFLLRSEAGKIGGKISGNRHKKTGHLLKFQAAAKESRKSYTSPVLIENMKKWAKIHWLTEGFLEKSIENLKIGLEKKVQIDYENFLAAMARAPRDEENLKFKSFRSKNKIQSHEGLIFDSVKFAAAYYGVPQYAVDNWAKREQYGWKRIPKTDRD